MSNRNFTDIVSHPICTSQSSQHIISFQCFKVISITVMSLREFGVLENVRAITQQIVHHSS